MYKKANNFNQAIASRVKLHEVVTDFNVDRLSLCEQRESITASISKVDKELRYLKLSNKSEGKSKERSKRRKELIQRKIQLTSNIVKLNAEIGRRPIPRTLEGHFYDVTKETLDKVKYLMIFNEAKRRAMLDIEQEIT